MRSSIPWLKTAKAIIPRNLGILNTCFLTPLRITVLPLRSPARRRVRYEHADLAMPVGAVFAAAECKGYGVVNFTPRTLSNTSRALHDVARRDSDLKTLAQLEVSAGKTILEHV